MIKLAKLAWEKGYGFEQFKYSDYMYGQESFADEVWDFVDEIKSIGIIEFDSKYNKKLKNNDQLES